MMMRIDDDTDRAELAEYLTNLCNFAKRQQRLVGDSKNQTDWDKAHRRMDGPIDDWLAAEA